MRTYDGSGASYMSTDVVKGSIVSTTDIVDEQGLPSRGLIRARRAGGLRTEIGQEKGFMYAGGRQTKKPKTEESESGRDIKIKLCGTVPNLFWLHSEDNKRL